jgi:lipoate---protein ligase
MICLDLTLPTPAENLAGDEALLEACEADGGEGWLRFWQPQSRFVVIGYGNPAATEVNLAACREHAIPVFRRCSGGGTVLQGPGCLNYSLILEIDSDGPLHSIPSANRFIMERNRKAIEAQLKFQTPGLQTPDSKSQMVEVRGHTDLAIAGRKFSGNAQRRRKRFLLFHGTFLLAFDLAWVERLLPMPARQPAYRQQRSHGEFLRNLELPAAAVKQALREAWSAGGPEGKVPRETISRLARDKYATTEWNLKF